MKTIILAFMVLLATNAFAQKTNLSRLPEKERNQYLIEKAKDAIMTYGPDWYRNYKEPVIKEYVIPEPDPDKGRKEYSVEWYYDPAKETMAEKFAVSVGVYEDTGEVRLILFGDGALYLIPEDGTKSRNSTVLLHACPYPKPR